MFKRTRIHGKDLQWLKLNGSGIKPDLIAQWHDLLNRTDCRDPFLTPQWLLPWLDSGEGRNQLLVALRCNRLIFLMPMRNGAFLKQLGGFLESEQQDLALICPQANAGELAGSMLAFTHPSFIRLDAMQKYQPMPLVAHCEAAGWGIVAGRGKQSPYVKITCDWETYWRERKTKVRKKYSRCSLKIQQELSARTILATTIEEVNQWLPAMAQLEQNSWKSATGIFSPANIEQTRQRLSALAEADKLRLFILAADRQLLAYNVTLFHRKRLWYYNTAFNAEYKEFSPGIHLMVEMIKHGFDHNLKSVEMLGGRQRNKMEWTQLWRQRTTAYLFSPGWSTTIGTAGLRFLRFAKSSLKRSHGA
jgi:CelD/BcsL family acetyltransferase involved in cellulose biosynthesis